MLSHLTVFYYIFLFLIGLMSLGICIWGTLRSKVSHYWLLVLFHLGFTGITCVLFIQQYIHLNIQPDSMQFLLITQTFTSVFTVGLLCSITLYFQQLFIIRNRVVYQGSLLVISLINIALIVFGDGWSLNETQQLLEIHNVLIVSIGLTLLMFVYLLILGVFGTKKDRAKKELILIWSITFFAGIGFLENFIALLMNIGSNTIEVSLILGDFLVASIPFVFFCMVLIYYFSNYILALQQLQKKEGVNSEFYEKYNLSTREQEVLVLLNLGLSNSEIGEKLFISLATVKTHVHHIYEKTKVNSRYKLFHLCMSAS